MLAHQWTRFWLELLHWVDSDGVARQVDKGNVLNCGKVTELRKKLAGAIVTCCLLNCTGAIVFNVLVHLAKLKGWPFTLPFSRKFEIISIEASYLICCHHSEGMHIVLKPYQLSGLWKYDSPPMVSKAWNSSFSSSEMVSRLLTSFGASFVHIITLIQLYTFVVHSSQGHGMCLHVSLMHAAVAHCSWEGHLFTG